MVAAVISHPTSQASTKSRPEMSCCSPSASAAAVSGLLGWLLNVAMSSFSSACDAAALSSVAYAGVVLKSAAVTVLTGTPPWAFAHSSRMAPVETDMPANWLPIESRTRFRTRSTAIGGTSS
jgi:hypothetical protein